MKSLAYEGITVEFFSPAGKLPPHLPPEEYLLSRERPLQPKVETPVPTDLPEVINLAREYDRWDLFEAPPKPEGDA